MNFEGRQDTEQNEQSQLFVVSQDDTDDGINPNDSVSNFTRTPTTSQVAPASALKTFSKNPQEPQNNFD